MCAMEQVLQSLLPACTLMLEFIMGILLGWQSNLHFRGVPKKNVGIYHGNIAGLVKLSPLKRGKNLLPSAPLFIFIPNTIRLTCSKGHVGQNFFCTIMRQTVAMVP